MPLKCYICSYYDSKRSYYRIPDRNNEYCDRSGLWIKLLDASKENIDKIRICSEHFADRKPANTGDIWNIDWCPNKNLRRFSKNYKHVEYYFKKKKMMSPEEKTYSEVNEQCGVVRPHSNTNSTRAANSNENTYAMDGEFPQSNTTWQLTGYTNQSSDSALISNECHTYKDQLPDLSYTNRSFDSICDSNESHASQAKRSGPSYTNQSSTKSIFVNSQTHLPIPLKRKKRIHIIQEQFFIAKEIQTDLSSDDVEFLFQYYKESVIEREAMLLKMASLVIDYDFFKNNNKKTLFYTGMPTWTLLNSFHELVEENLPNHHNGKLSRFQMTALVLMKLRLNLSFSDIGYRFQVNVSTASRYFQRGIYILHKLFHGSKIIHWPERNNLLINTPSYFRSTFKEAITIIIDCFELFIERSSVLKALAQSFSFYKHHNTLKFLIGITTTGVIIFVSIGFGGRASDNEVTLKSGFLDNLEEGDLVLADKGFKIEDKVEEKGASLRLPCFVKKKKQLHPTQVERTRHIANVRIHVERVISILRQKFNICSDMAQMSAVSKTNDLFDRDMYDKIIFVCSSLVNICPSVVKNDFEM